MTGFQPCALPLYSELTDLGRQWKTAGTPEERILRLIKEKQGLSMPEIAQALGIENKDVGSAFGALSKLGVLAMDGAKRVALAAAAELLENGLPASGEAAAKMTVLRGLLEKAAAAPGGLLADADLSDAERLAMAGVAKKRGASDAAFRIVERETVVYGFTADRDELAAALEAAGITGDEIGTLTPELLASGAWKGAAFRSYNVKVPPTRLLVGRSNPYAKFPVYTGMTTYQYYFNENGTLKQYSLTGTPTLYGYNGAEAKSNFDYVGEYFTDSAAAVTAMSTGVKTYGGGIGVDVYRKASQNIAEIAIAQGKAAGNISSVQFTHATPAGFGAHVDSRNNYKQIAQQQLFESKLTVLMGAGHPLYDDNGQLLSTPKDNYVGGISVYNGIKDGKTTIDWSREDTDPFTGTKTQYSGTSTVQDIDGDKSPDAWTLVENKAAFQALASGATPKRVFGLAKVAQTLQYNRKTTAAAKIAFNDEAKVEQLVLEKTAAKAAYNNIPDVTTAAYADPQVADVPTLQEMTRAALNVLDNDPDGFFLHIEGGAVDWAGHGNWMGRMIEEQQDFNNSVQAVIEWVEKNSNWNETLVIVTGDHETGMLTGPDGKTEKQYFKPVVNNGKGKMPSGEFFSNEHTNQIIPLYAKGTCSDMFMTISTKIDPVRGSYMDNTDIFKVMNSACEGYTPTGVPDAVPVQFETGEN